MMRVVLFVLALGLTSALDLDAQWMTFKKAYSKQYTDVQEEIIRRKIWEFNLDFIQKHNMEADLGIHSFWVGVNEFADLTNREFVQKMNGYKMREGPREGATYMPPSNVGDLPDTVDWRTKGYVTPVKNQGQCGSCWAFSTTGSMEGHHFRSTGKLLELSEQQLVDCSTGYGNEACNGGWMDFAFAYIFAAGGLENEASYPYYAKYGDCRFYSGWIVANLSGCYDVTKYSEADLEKAVASVGPVSVAIDASHQSFMSYSGGVYYEPECREDVQDHAVLVVGYGTQDGQDYWIVKNSWGETWGDQGYIKMARNRSNMCGIATSASFPV